MGLRPDHASVVYGNLIRRTYKDTPVIMGGVEASLRRLAHYDYWSDKLKRSVLLDGGADMISYGMGEKSIVAIADALNAGIPIGQITWIEGTAFRSHNLEGVKDGYVSLPSFESMRVDKLKYAESFRLQYRNLDPFSGKCLVEPYEQDNLYVVQNPPSTPLSTSEFDAVYRLPYERTYHPMYEAAGGIPAISEVKFSLTSNRGCIGECSFCSLAFHQGRIIQSRSKESLVEEAKTITQDPDFKGYINDVGGPTANFRKPACPKQLDKGACRGKRCLAPKPCRSLQVDNRDYLNVLRELRSLPGVKKVFVRSGLRFDYVLLDKHANEFIDELSQYHVSGQLRLAPEHVSDEVLKVMGKPNNDTYQEFVRRFEAANKKLGLKQFVVPYLMSSHPGSTLKEAVELAEFCRDMGFNPEQVQDFYPTPSTISTCIYFTGVDPRTMEEVYCPRTPHEKAMQRALIQYRNPKNRKLVIEALKAAGREDLIGYDEKCLVRPDKGGARKANNHAKGAKDPRGKRQGSSSDARPHSKGAAAAGNPKGKSRHGNGASSQREKHAGKSEVSISGGKANGSSSRNALGGRARSHRDARFDKGKVSPSRGSFKPQGRGPNKAAGSKGGIRRQGSKR